jgi:transcriptional regulator with XRE-family HTH domain
MTATPQQLGQAIKGQRHAQHMTLAVLGSRAHLSAKHVGEIERGTVDRRWTSVGNIAEALCSSVCELNALGEDLPGEG